MFNCEQKLSSVLNEDIGKLILRLSIAVLMLFHGYKKYIFGIEGIKTLVIKTGLPEVLAYGVYVGEIIIPILLILGFRTRVCALLLSFTMAFAIPLAHSEKLFLIDAKTGGLAIELPLLYLLSALSLFFIGGGKYSIDAKLCSCHCKV